MKIIVFGASGGVGKQFIQQALSAKHEVTAFVRDAAKLSLQHPLLTIVQGDGLDEQAVINAISGHDAVICTVGSRGMGATTLMSDILRHIIAGMEKANVNRIAYVASAGIHKELTGFIGGLAGLLLKNVLADHHRAYELLKNSGLNWTVARPMSLTNSELTGIYRETLTGIPSKGQKISRADVAHFLLKVITENTHSQQSVGLAY